MKLIKVREAAERLGISRQTIENWGKSGVLDIHKISKNSHYVDAETIDALANTMQDVENTRKLLKQEQEKLEEDYRKERQLRRDVERELFVGGKLCSAVCCKEFYLSIPMMLCEIGLIRDAECVIMCKIIGGQGVSSIAEEYGLSRSRILQIFTKGCRKARELSGIKEQLYELQELRQENNRMKEEIKMMANELKMRLKAEQELKEMDEAERIKRVEESDALLKLYNTRVEDYHQLSIRTRNILINAGVKTIGDLAKLTRHDFRCLRNAGKKSLMELEEFLNSIGVSFGTDVDKVYHEHIALYLSSKEA